MPFASAFRARFNQGAGARRRTGLLFRIVAGVGGGYAVAALCTMVLSLGLPMPRAEAVLTATMASFAIYAGLIIWAFAAHRVLCVWAGMAATAALLGLALAVMQGALP
jgi:hypothetical protein